MNQHSALGNELDTGVEGTPQLADKPLVLIVDDHDPSRAVLHLIMQQFGFKALIADTADAAIVELQASTNGFDVLLMDYLLGADDGLAVAATMRAMALADCKTASMHTILVTGAPELVQRQTLAWNIAKIAGVLHKPISTRSLFGHLEPFHDHMKSQAI